MNQSGRSMIEMLGVLAIVGVLSVGALAGYSMAMSKHKMNVAASNLEQIVFNTLDLYETRNIKDYTTITKDVLVNAGVLPEDPNIFGENIYVSYTDTMLMLRYGVTDEKACRAIVLSSEMYSISHYLSFVAAGRVAIGSKYFHRNGVVDSDFPLTISDASYLCSPVSGTELRSITIGIYFSGTVSIREMRKILVYARQEI